MAISDNQQKNKPEPEKKSESDVKNIEDFISNSRKLAEDYVVSKRRELERYANDALKTAQDRLSKALDDSLLMMRDRIGGFVKDLSGVIASGVKSIDEKPLVPVASALVGGVVFGLFLGTRRRSLKTMKRGSPELAARDVPKSAA